MIQTEDKNFSRDINTKALVNTNRVALVEHRFRQEQVRKLEELRRDLDTLARDFLLMKQYIEEIRAHNG
jgi:hypothetical protein